MARHVRMIDANANRAREALRVMEDLARFALDDDALSRDLKSLRHRLRDVLERLPDGVLAANRDTPGDVGTSISTTAEMQRANLADLATAAGKRLTEALRVLEELAKLFDAELAAEVERLRYAGYELDRRLQLRLGSGRARPWPLCVLLTESLCALPWRQVLTACLEGGVTCVQVREPDFDAASLLDRVREVIAVARPHGVSVIVNDRLDIALAADADGVHLGTRDLPITEARRLAGRTLLIGASTHDLEEAQRAVAAGADYCGVGPMFFTELKPDRAPAGASYLREFLRTYAEVPHLAIGGITPENVQELTEAGARSIAVSRCVCGSSQPGAVLRQLHEALDGAAPNPARARDTVPAERRTHS